MPADSIAEARRQVAVCNACRYCEGYCSVFPAIHRERVFADGDVTQLANLCHNCRGCYYACQYTEPHEFALNLPAILAEVRQESWQRYAFPSRFAAAFHTSGAAIALATVVGFALLIGAIGAIDGEGEGFYALLPHDAMVAIFAPAFLFPLFALGVGLGRYWRAVGGAPLARSDIGGALRAAAGMKNLAGGHGDGCNFEDEDRFSHARRHAHQAVLYGFLLCFASTSVATVMHYVLDMPAPYGLLSMPKLLGVPGGVLLSVGTLWLVVLKLKSDRRLSAARAWGGDMGFVLLLLLVGVSGLALYALGGTALLGALLALHLGSVLAFFLLTPYSKMAHGFYRLAALARDEQIRRLHDEAVSREAVAGAAALRARSSPASMRG